MNPLPTLHLVRVVVASPSDVKSERKIIEKLVDELNKTTAKEHALHLDLVLWETEATPGFDREGAQAVIDKALRIEESQLLIGIFWKRFGTPVKDAKSGTEHEFRKAYDAWKRTGHPEIMFYFNEQPYKLDTPEDLEQLRLVMDFQKAFPEDGLWWAFNGADNFEQTVREHLRKFILRMSTPATNAVSTQTMYAPPPLEEQIALWVKLKKTKRTKESYERSISKFRQELHRHGLDLDSEDERRIASLAEDWAHGEKGGSVSNATFNLYLTIVSSFYIFAIKRNWVKSNPIHLLERRKKRRANPPKALDAEFVKNKLKAIDRSDYKGMGKRDYAILCILLTTGLHVTEVKDLRCGNISRVKNTLTITFKQIRNGELMTVALGTGTARALNEHLVSLYPNGYANDDPVWDSKSHHNQGGPISNQAISDICRDRLGCSRVEVTRQTYEAMIRFVGVKGIEKLLGIN